MIDATHPVSELTRSSFELLVHGPSNRCVEPDAGHHDEIARGGEGARGRGGDVRPVSHSPRLPVASFRFAERDSSRLSRCDRVRQSLDVERHREIARNYVCGATRPYRERRFTSYYALKHFVKRPVTTITDDDLSSAGHRVACKQSGVVWSVRSACLSIDSAR